MTATADRRPAGAVAMLVHAYYEEDPRVRREAEALAAAGRRVDVFALRRPQDPPEGELHGVAVHRLDVQRHQGASLRTYALEYLAFAFRAAVALVRAHRRRRFRVVQVHTLPDFLVFATLPLRLTGTPVLLDLHEAMPEFFASRFAGGRPGGLAYRLLRLQERAAIVFATRVVTVNAALDARLAALGVADRKRSIVPNAPSLARFDPDRHPRRPFAADGMVRLVYAGGLSPIYELDVVVDAIASLRRRRPDLPLALDVYGRDFLEVPLDARASDAGVGDAVRLHGRIPLEDVPAAIASADIGLAPTRRNAFTDFSLSTKLYEYAAMGKPVIASRLPMVEAVFGDTVATYAPGDPEDLARAIERLADDADGRARTAEAGRARVTGLAWEREAPRYVALVDELAGDRG